MRKDIEDIGGFNSGDRKRAGGHRLQFHYHLWVKHSVTNAFCLELERVLTVTF